MGWARDFLNWWTRMVRYLAVPIFLGFILLAWVSPALDREFFCGGEGSCFREWFSALSGWAAFGAAIVTVDWLKRQIRDANRHQSENVELTIMGRLAAAENFVDALDNIHYEVETLGAFRWLASQEFRDCRIGSPLFGLRVSHLGRILTALKDDRVKTYEQEIGLRYPSSTALRQMDILIEFINLVKKTHNVIDPIPANIADDIQHAAAKAAAAIMDFGVSGRLSADAFIFRWRTRIHSGADHSAASR